VLEILTFASVLSAEAACAAQLSQALLTALAITKGRVSFMVSGGNTPRRVLPLVLAEVTDWDRVDVFASDERLVPVGHPDSTEGMVREVFAAAGRPLHYLGFGADTTPEVALPHWQDALKNVWPVAAGLIGIGEDAHFASLFPKRPEIGEPQLFAAAVPETAPHKHPRLTLGRAAFAKCELLTLVATGSTKRRVLNLSRLDKADYMVLPVAVIGEIGRVIAFTD